MAKRRARVEELEPRVLLSGDLAGALALPPAFESGDEPRGVVEPVAPSGQHQTLRELVFIDSGIEDWETLVDDLLTRGAGQRSIEVVLLDSERDGVAQIAEALADSAYDLDAVHVVSHGTERGLQLGGTWLDPASLESRADLVAGWRDALSEDADLLLYGCNLAASAEGKALIEQLAGLTGADVAASVDRTGAAALGGDWDLEHTTGQVEAFVVFTARAQQGFGTLLEGTAVWTDKNTGNPQTSDFDAGSFGTESNTAAVGEWQVIAGAEAPTRDEMIVVGVGTNDTLTGQIWDGSTWTALPGVIAGLKKDEWAFDVAYSSQSGDALIAWADAGGINFVVWDGTTASAPIGFAAPVGGEPTHLKLAADPNSDEIMVVGSIDGVGDFAMVWDGTDFVDGQVFPVVPSDFVTDIDVVYEGQSGNAMVIYGGGSAPLNYQVYDGSTWTSGLVAPPSLGLDEARWTSIAADPNSNRIAIAVGTDKNEVWLAVWDGSAWQPSVQALEENPHNDQQAVAVAFEGQSGRAIAAYATNNDQVYYQTWTAGGGWSGEQVGPDLGDHVHALTLDADPASNTVMLSTVNNSKEAHFIAWDGASWGAPNLLESDTGTNEGQPFVFMWESAVPNTAPVLTPSAPSLPSITEDDVNDSGELIANLLGGSVSDPDALAVGGMAITNITSTGGSWEYSLNGGALWNTVPVVVSSTQALLLRDSDRLRFVPDAANGEVATFDFQAWDQTTGSAGSLADASVKGGATAFSVASDTGTIIVSDVNDAPFLGAATGTLVDVAENAGPPAGAVGTLVSSLVDLVGGGGLDNVKDVDTGALTGIAVTASNSTNGTWYYSIDDGASWLLLGSPSVSAARLLAADGGTRVYFEPDPGFSGTVVNGLTFRAWDQASGTNGGVADTAPPGGTSAFSSAQLLADITVTASREPSGTDNTVLTDEDVAYVFQVADFGFSDPNGDLFSAVVITTIPGGGTLRNGAAVLVGGETIGEAAILAGDLTYTPAPHQNGSPYTSFTFQVQDDSGLVGQDTDPTPNTMTIGVTPINDAPQLTPSAPSLPTIDENAVSNAGELVSNLLGSSVFELDAGALGGVVITNLTGSNGTWQYSLDGGGLWTAVPTNVSDTAALLLRDVDRVRFVPDGLNADSASFDFRAWDQTTGSAGSQTGVGAGGGTSAFSAATDTASIGVTGVNDAPGLTPSSPSLTSITEDDLVNSGNLVSDLLGSAVSDVDNGDSQGIAIAGVNSGNGSWEYSLDGGTVWNAVGPVSYSSALLLRDTDRVRFVPDGENADAASFDFRAWDQSLGTAGSLADASAAGGATPFSAASDTAAISVTALNDAPLLNPSAPTLTPITEDDVANPGDLVSDILGGSMTDVDGDPEGIAITGLSSGNGAWEFSTDGGTVWNAVPGGVSETAALLLRDLDRVRFVPDGLNDDTASFDYRGWDQSVGTEGTQANASTTGGVAAFSSSSDTASIDVSSVNDAPVLTPAAPSLTGITEDELTNPGDLVSSLLAGAADVDTGALSGIAITSLASSNGSWEFSTDGGAIWNDVGVVSDSGALLLRDTDRVRFVPDGLDADAASFDFRAWDRTSGSAGSLGDTTTNGGVSAFSTGVDTASIAVSDVNDAPTLDPTGSMTLTNVVEDDPNPPGDTVAAIVLSATGDRIADVDAGASEGLAVIGVDDSNGTWQYSTDGGGVWTDFGAVSDTTAVLLDEAARIRFVPGASYTGAAGDIDFRAWDQTNGSNGQVGVDVSTNGGTTAFSTDIETATLDVIATNDAPVLTPGAPSLSAITEDDTSNGGELVSTIVGSSIADLDSGALEGIAVTGLASGNGTWEFSLDGGAVWNAVPSSVSDSAALLLRDTDLIRFVPDAMNADAPTFDFRAWDRTTGSVGSQVDASTNGGTTAFSLATDTASLTVSALNDAPVMIPAAPSLTPISEDALANAGDLVSSLLAGVSDVDASALGGIAITSLTPSNGTWEFSTDGGALWSAVGAVSDSSALLLRGVDRVRFVPDGVDADSASFDFRGWDQTTGTFGNLGDSTLNGGTTAFSSVCDTATISITAVNDAPVLDDTGNLILTDVAESDPSPGGDTVATILLSDGGNRITDVDPGDPEGVAVVSVDDTNGSWQYSTDGGGIWTAFGAVSNSAAVLLDSGALVRFVPTTAYVGPSGDIQFRAWDQSVGSNGQTGVDTSAAGLATPFSVGTETASLNVVARNFAPVLTPGAPSLTTISEDATANGGDLVGNLISGSIADLNAGSKDGIAITSLASGNGTWQYSTDAGGSWAAVGTVSNASALLLRDVDRVRFVPDAQNADSASFGFHAWDQTAGSAGAKVDASATGDPTAFSVASDSAAIAVTALNDAPSLGSGTLAGVSADETNPPGASVGSLFGAVFSDADAGAGLAGIAVVSNTADAASEGVWEYSSDGGVHWFAIGSVGDDASALVLASGSQVRFVPVASFAGTTGLAVRGLDDAYTGAGSSTAGGVESRANVDASLNGGTTPIAAGASSLSTTILAGTPPIDLPDDPDPPPDPPAPPVDPPVDPPVVDPGDPADPPLDEPPAPDPGSGGGSSGVPGTSVPSPIASVAPGIPTGDVAGAETLDDDRTKDADREAGVRTALDVLRDVYMGSSSLGAQVLTDLIFNGQRGDFLGELDAAQTDLLALSELEVRMVGSSIAVTSGLSVGYVLWLTRGGLLIASLLSSLPAWRLVDPIPILARLGSDEESDEAEEESLDSMVNADQDPTEDAAGRGPS